MHISQGVKDFYLGSFVSSRVKDKSKVPFDGNIPKGTIFQITDIFVASSHFYGDLLDLNGNFKRVEIIISLKDSQGADFFAKEFFIFDPCYKSESKEVVLKPKFDQILAIPVEVNEQDVDL